VTLAAFELDRRLEAFFSRSDLRPGAYDEPQFSELEKSDPTILDAYAQYVLAREQTKKEGQRIRKVVRSVVKRFVADVDAAALRRRCDRATYALLKMLEALDVWAFAVHGCLCVQLPPEVEPEPQFFSIHSVHSGPNYIPGHFWLVVPPYQVVDITARHQDWPPDQERLIDPAILLANARIAPPMARLHSDPEIRHQVPPMSFEPFQRFWSWLPPIAAQVGSVSLQYQPYAVRVPPPEETLESLPLSVNGLNLREYLETVVRPQL
jgi:hypothetical protein